MHHVRFHSRNQRVNWCVICNRKSLQISWNSYRQLHFKEPLAGLQTFTFVDICIEC